MSEDVGVFVECGFVFIVDGSVFFIVVRVSGAFR